MAGKLLGEDCSITVTLGSRNADASINWGSTVNSGTFKALIKKATLNESSEMKNARCMGDDTQVYRAIAPDATIDIDTLVATTGYLFNRSTGIAGTPIQIVFDEGSALSDPKTYIGLIKTWKGEASEGEIQAESITIQCGLA